MLIYLHEFLHEVIYKSHIKSDILVKRQITERPIKLFFLGMLNFDMNIVLEEILEVKSSKI